MVVSRFIRKNRAALRRIWQMHRPWIILAVFSLIIFSAGQMLDYGRFDLRQAFIDNYANLSTELLSIALTLSVISVLSRQQARLQRDEEREKVSLLKRLPIAPKEEKQEIIKRLRDTDYLVDGTLHNVAMPNADLRDLNLSNADMEGINLAGARLQNSDLNGADLQGANLTKALMKFTRFQHARLIEANLSRANLQQADLSSADLRYADLELADLRGAVLDEADLRGTNLKDANLCGACLELQFNGSPFSEAKLDGATTLPDGSKWTLDADLRRYTDSDHPEFWQSEAPTLPAGEKNPA